MATPSPSPGDTVMGPHERREIEEVSDLYSEDGSLSRCNSLDRIPTYTVLGDGVVEEKFRVDRKKLEAMILGYPTDPCDLETLKTLPVDSQGRILSADQFFHKIMEETNTEIKYPKFLKVGARNKKDPHVRVVGEAEAVKTAGMLVRQDLEQLNKITMKLDVSWTHHSHIIGKGGNTIQPIVKRAGVSIHFPDGNKNSDVRKSNQVSINSRGMELAGLEEARAAIRDLTPLIFSFSLSASAQFVTHSDPSMLVIHVQNTYNVQVELKMTEDTSPMILGTVRGCEWDSQRVKEATLYLLQAYCDTLATQMPVQMTVEISPQHQTFVLGRNNECLKRIMQRTATKITFPDVADPLVSHLHRSTVTISGAIDNVYLARQNIIGSLPLVLMFEITTNDQPMENAEVAQLMQTLDVLVQYKQRRVNGHLPVLVKGAERNSSNIYEAYRQLTRSDKPVPKAQVPSTYHISEANCTYGLQRDFGISQWLSGGCSSGGSSPIPSPSPTPAPPLLWGGYNPPSLSSSNTRLYPLPSSSSSTHHYPAHQQLPRTHYTNMLHDNPYSNCYNSGLLRSSSQGYNSSSSSNSSFMNYNNPLSGYGTGKHNTGGVMSGLGLGSIVNGLNGITLSNGDGMIGSHSGLQNSSGSNSDGSPSLSSPSPPSPSPLAPSPSPDRLLGTHVTSEYNHQDQVTSSAISALLQSMDRRAPGCEKKLELEAQKMNSLSDYNSKKVQAARAMKEQVDASPRTPTSSWSGYGFSKSMPGFMLRSQLQNRQTQKAGLEEWEGWQGSPKEQDEGDCVTAANDLLASSQSSLQYSNIAQLGGLSSNDNNTLTPLSATRPMVSLSSSNFMDCLLPHSLRHVTRKQSNTDLTSVLNDLQLEQYIDVFAAQEVDLRMFLTLDDNDLKELGIKIFGHRKRILMAIKNMSRNQMLSSVSEGTVINPSPSSSISAAAVSSTSSSSSASNLREVTSSVAWD